MGSKPSGRIGETKAAVSSSIKVSSSNGTTVYAVILCNITSGLLAYGILDTSSFLRHYEEVIYNIPEDISVSANNLISNQCMAAL